MALSLDQILGVNDREVVAFNVPEWGGDVLIRVLTAWEKELLARKLFSKTGDANEKAIGVMKATWAAECLCDEAGNRIIPDNKIRAFADKNHKIMERIFDECQRVNALTKEKVDDAEKNSETTP